MVTLSPSGLVEITTADPNWVVKFNTNLTLLNNSLLKVSALGDVNIAGLVDKAVLRYNSGTSKWIPWVPDVPFTP